MTHPCTNCKSEVEETDLVCPVCGHDNVTSTPVHEPDLTENQEPQPANTAAATQFEHFPEPETFEYSQHQTASLHPRHRFVVFRCNACQIPLVPGTNLCPKCGRTLAQPVPKIEIHPSSEPPLFRYGQYVCPECQSTLAPGSSLCSACGAEFLDSVPAAAAEPGPLDQGPVIRRSTGRLNDGNSLPWKVGAAIVVVLVLGLIGWAIFGNHSAPDDSTATAISNSSTSSAPESSPPAPAATPVTLAGGSQSGQVPSTAPSPVGTWKSDHGSIRLDPMGGAWVEASSITGSSAPEYLKWELGSTNNEPIIHVSDTNYTWDFKWSFGDEGTDTLSNPQWGELKRASANPAAKPAKQ